MNKWTEKIPVPEKLDEVIAESMEELKKRGGDSASGHLPGWRPGCLSVPDVSDWRRIGCCLTENRRG